MNDRSGVNGNPAARVMYRDPPRTSIDVRFSETARIPP